jgi:hypothetical protein
MVVQTTTGFGDSTQMESPVNIEVGFSNCQVASEEVQTGGL